MPQKPHNFGDMIAVGNSSNTVDSQCNFCKSGFSAFYIKIAEEMCDSSRILMSPRLGSEKDEEEVHKNEFHYVFCQAVAASYWILILAFSSLKKR